MRAFKSFFILSLVFFLFLSFSKFLLLAFFAATILTFVSFVARKMREVATFRREYHYDRHRPSYLPAESNEEPLFYEKPSSASFNWENDYRVIEVK